MSESLVAPLFTLIGALLTAIIAALVAILNSHREMAKEERLLAVTQAEQCRQSLTDRASVYLATAHHAVLCMRELAEAEPRKKSIIDKQVVWPTVDPVNRALAAIKINDASEVVDATVALDAAMVELLRHALRQRYSRDQWRELRARIIGDKPDRVVEAARRQAELLGNVRQPRREFRRRGRGSVSRGPGATGVKVGDSNWEG